MASGGHDLRSPDLPLTAMVTAGTMRVSAHP